jgi:hypothetical protein
MDNRGITNQLSFDEAEELGLDGTLRTDNVCGICEEGLETDYAEPIGEFWDAEKNHSVVAHAQCGFDAELYWLA